MVGVCAPLTVLGRDEAAVQFGLDSVPEPEPEPGAGRPLTAGWEYRQVRQGGGCQWKVDTNGSKASRAPCGIGHDALALARIIAILKINYRHLTSSSFLIPAKIAGRQDCAKSFRYSLGGIQPRLRQRLCTSALRRMGRSFAAGVV